MSGILVSIGMHVVAAKVSNEAINRSCLGQQFCAGALLGDKVASWLDPLVAMVLSVWLIYAWGGQAYYNVMNLVGLSATPQFLQKLTYLCWNHDPRILQIDTVR